MPTHRGTELGWGLYDMVRAESIGLTQRQRGRLRNLRNFYRPVVRKRWND
jgi:hypothetical protein